MKSPKQSRPRHKLSFAVDRAEIDISSDWVDAITRERETPRPDFPAPDHQLEEQRGSATVAHYSTVASTDTVVQEMPVAASATVDTPAAVVSTSTVATGTTVALSATRAPRPRPIRRITDGLTPGQFAVYSLMYEHGDPQPEKARLYRGGYLDLCHLTGLSKRGIQNVIAELQIKDAISIHQAPGYHKSQTTIYRVRAEDVVVTDWLSRGYRYSIGKGKRLAASATVAVPTTVATSATE